MDGLGDTFDPKVLDSLTNGNPTLRSAVIASFLTCIPMQLSGLDRAIALNDHEMVRFHVHSIKGMARQVGAIALRALALQFELVGADNTVQLMSLHEKMSCEFEDLNRILTKYQPN